MMDDTSFEQEIALILGLLQRTRHAPSFPGNLSLDSSNASSPAERHIHSFIHNVLTPLMSRHGAANSSFLDGKLYAAEPTGGGGGVFFTGGEFQDHNSSSSSSSLSPSASQQHIHNVSATENGSLDYGCSSRSYEYADYTQQAHVRDCFVALYVIVLVLSVLGNLMVIYTVWRNQHMRTTTNYYIVNLAVCDFLVGSFVMPLKLLEYVAPCSWQVFGHSALCSIVSFILPVVVFASVLTLVAISIERHRTIMFPMSALRSNNKTRTRIILAVTWAVPLLLASPYLFCRSYAFNIHSAYGSISRQICNDRFDDIDAAMYGPGARYSGTFRQGFFLFLFVSIYLVPMLLIVTTCVRIAKCLLEPIHLDQAEACTHGNMRMTKRREESKRRIAKMVITVALSFIVCWSPFYWVTLVSQVQEESFLRHSNFLFTMLTTHLIGFVNSAVNPLIYHAMNERFRKSFRNIFFRTFCCILPLLNRRRQFSWTARCDGMSAPYCGYVGSTLDSSNPDGRHLDAKPGDDGKLHAKRCGTGTDVLRPSRRRDRPPPRHLGPNAPRIVVGECSANGHFVAKKITVSEKYGNNVRTNIFTNCKPTTEKCDQPRVDPRVASNFPLIPQFYSARVVSANASNNNDISQRCPSMVNKSSGLAGSILAQATTGDCFSSPTSENPDKSLLSPAHVPSTAHSYTKLTHQPQSNNATVLPTAKSHELNTRAASPLPACDRSCEITRTRRRWSYDEAFNLLAHTW